MEKGDLIPEKASHFWNKPPLEKIPWQSQESNLGPLDLKATTLSRAQRP
jgi:hypothetical protein